MPLIAIFLGTIMLVAGVRNSQGELIGLWREQTTGEQSFFGWLFALVLIGSFGYIRELQPLSRAFLVLVIVVILLSNSRDGESVLTMLQKQLFGRFQPGSIARPEGASSDEQTQTRAADIRAQLKVLSNE